MYPKCAKAKGKCELENVVIGEPTIVDGELIGREWQQPSPRTLYTHVWDKDHIIETCITPSLMVAANDLGFPIRPLKILGVVDEAAFKANQQGVFWRECPRHKIKVNGCSRYFECERCISENKKKTSTPNTSISMSTRQTTRRNLSASVRMDMRLPTKPRNESIDPITRNINKYANSGD